MVKFVICDDQELFRRGIKSALADDNFKLVGEASNGIEAWELLSTSGIDILICDISMPKMTGLELLDKINKEKLNIKVLMLSGYDNDEYLLQAYKSGASGYLLKETDPDELKMAINKIYQGGIYFGQHAMSSLFKQVTSVKTNDLMKANDYLHKKLSLREIEILQLIVKGLTNKEIAEKIFLSVRTIDSHRANIQDKLSAKNTADLVRIYYNGA